MPQSAITAQTSAHAALAAPGGELDWTITGSIAGTVDGLQLRDLLGDGQTLDPARPPDVIITSGGATLFSGAVTPTERRDPGSGVTTVGLDLSAALRAAGLTGTAPAGAEVQVVLHSVIGADYATTTQPLLSSLVGQGDPLDNAAEFTATQAGQAVNSDPVSGRLVLPSSQLAVEVYAVNGVVGAAAVRPGDSVTYRLRLAMPLGTAQAVQVQAVIPGLAGTVAWDGAGGSVLPATGHAALGLDSTAGLAPQAVSVVPGVGGPALELDFGNVAAAAGATPAVIDVLYTAALPAGVSRVQATSVEENSFGGVSSSAASADFAAPVPQLLLQTASMNDTGLQSSFFAVGNGSGSPVAFSTDFGQFSGPVTSAALASDPFSDRLADVAAGDLVTFVIAVQNVTAGAPAYGIVLRDSPPAGFVVPSGGAGIVVTTGDGMPLAATGNLFDPAGGLAFDPAAPLLGYSATSGQNVALVAFTLQATSSVPSPRAMLANTAQVVAFAGSPGGANLATAALTATTSVATMAPTVTLVQTGTDAATPGGPLAVGQTVTLHATVTLPSGSSQALRIDPVLPAGLTLVSATITDVTLGTTGLAAGQASASGFDLGNYTAGSASTVGIDIVARAAGGSGGTVQAVVSAADPDGAAGRVSTSASATVPVLSPALSLTLTGVAAGVATSDTMPIAPFAALALADPNVSQTESVSVTLSDAQHGTLTNLGGGAYDPVAGIYTLAGLAALVQAALQGLLFVPAPHRAAAGGQVTTGVAVAVQDAAGGTASALTQVVATNLDALPAITGGVAGQSTTTTLAALPFAGLLLTDPDGGPAETLTVQGTPGLGSLQGGLGAYNPVTGAYTAQGTTAALAADVQGLVFTPGAAGMASFSVTLNDGAGGVAQDSTTSLVIAPSADTAGVAQHFMQLPGAQFLTLINGVQTTVEGEAYHGPVSYLQDQLILDSSSPAVIVAHTSNAFIKSFSGFSAIQVLGGQNVVDAGPGSNFIVGGTGNDTFFLDGTHGAVTWDTIQGFHPGDMMTLFGFNAGTSSLVWADAEGAAGYTGRTIHADLAGTGGVTANLTFAGTTAADTDRYVISTGTVGGMNYLAVVDPA